ncbi:Glycosyl hydrolases family 35 [Butyrivibrio sp. ob235]|uniref:GH35 family beta-galactosidase n=1 Tax=Butyrivibrio sp. ob235 TaxID=1761780 RepID=UPI0008B0DD34|nr:DUF5597 domain-containing protein [Butyrivibrio sp. ob235]SEM16474.1 Glycosyl hydrolases family 35 [Butyrivibrio sp. ob235]
MIPEIRKDNGIDTLYVHGQPFFALAGEIHNSSASDLEYMEKQVLPYLKDLNMNSVIVPVYWEKVEEQEGKFDFSLVRGIIDQARDNGMKLILLWFGLWKNAESMYVPGWMKKDTEKYFRVKKVNGELVNTISPFCDEAVQKDARAFKELMKFLRNYDEEESTVITMQVENEIGLLGTACDYSDAAKAAFEKSIPDALFEKLSEDDTSEKRTWRDVFKRDAEEAFMAYHFAKAVEVITASGREEYPLPCYANAWLKQYPWYAGSYPSGGPVTQMHKIWKAAAPSLFALAPDIYVSYVPDVMDEYHYEGNPLFIPEVRKDAVTASYCLYAFGKHNAICYSPFGIEELAMDPELINSPPMEVMIALNIDPTAFDIAGSKNYLARTYKLIEELKPLIIKYRGSDKLQSFVQHRDTDFGSYLAFKEYNIHVSYAHRERLKPVGGGMIFEIEHDKFLLAGTNCSFRFHPLPGENCTVGILRYEEGRFDNGEWKCGRILNGDEAMTISLGAMPECKLIEVYKY